VLRVGFCSRLYYLGCRALRLFWTIESVQDNCLQDLMHLFRSQVFNFGMQTTTVWEMRQCRLLPSIPRSKKRLWNTFDLDRYLSSLFHPFIEHLRLILASAWMKHSRSQPKNGPGEYRSINSPSFWETKSYKVRMLSLFRNLMQTFRLQAFQASARTLNFEFTFIEDIGSLLEAIFGTVLEVWSRFNSLHICKLWCSTYSERAFFSGNWHRLPSRSSLVNAQIHSGQIQGRPTEICTKQKLL
jgi:hypothetical protein